MTVKSSVSLTDAQFAFAKAMVEAGAAPSVSAVLQQGVELLRAQEEDRQLERQALRDILEARARGRTVSADAFDTGLAEMMDRKRKAHGLAS